LKTKAQILDYYQFVHQGQNYSLFHGNTRTQGCLGSFEKIVQDERFFSTDANLKQINEYQDG
jgi:hypothetical protein